MSEDQIRLHLAERWEPKDYLEAISAIETIYYILTFRHDFTDCPWLFELEDDLYYSEFRRPGHKFPRFAYSISDRLVEHSRLFADHDQRLFVAKISHASPGFIDFEGLGDVIRAVKEAVGDTVGFFTRRKIRKEEIKQSELETEKQRLDIESQKIRIAREKILLLDEIQEQKVKQIPVHMRLQLERALVEELSKIEQLAAKGLLTDEREHKDE